MDKANKFHEASLKVLARWVTVKKERRTSHDKIHYTINSDQIFNTVCSSTSDRVSLAE